MKPEHTTESKTQYLNLKDRLDLIEKKVDIQKKKIEIEKEKWVIDEMMKKQASAPEEVKLLLEKVTVLKDLLAGITVDSERTILGSEPFLTPIVTDKDRQLIKNKIMELITAF